METTTLENITLSTEMMDAYQVSSFTEALYEKKQKYSIDLSVDITADCLSVGLLIPTFSDVNKDTKYFIAFNNSEIEVEDINNYISHTFEVGKHTISLYAKTHGCYNPIIEIGEYEFAGKWYIKDNDRKYPGLPMLTNIRLPQSLKAINSYAFYNCTNLITVDVQVGVTSIKEGAFQNCTKLEKVVLPTTLITLGWNCFKDCTSLSDINLYGTSVLEIEYRTFMNCKSLKSIASSDGHIRLRKVGFQAFMGSGLESFKLASNFNMTIGKQAFADCTSLSEIKVAGNGSQFAEAFIFDNAFENCTSLAGTIDITNSRIMGAAVFKGCSNITGIKCDSPTTTIINKVLPPSIFQDCTGLTGTIDLSNSDIEAIDKMAFRGCKNIKKIILPNTIRRIYAGAFSDCNELYAQYDSGHKDCINVPYCLEYVSWTAFVKNNVHTNLGNDLFYKDSANANGYGYTSLKGAIRERMRNALSGLTDTSTVGEILTALRGINY